MFFLQIHKLGELDDLDYIILKFLIFVPKWPCSWICKENARLQLVQTLVESGAQIGTWKLEILLNGSYIRFNQVGGLYLIEDHFYCLHDIFLSSDAYKSLDRNVKFRIWSESN